MQSTYYSMIGAPPQRTPLSMESHRSYLSSSQVPAARPSLFHRRNERIDWRRIAAVDVDRIARDMDFQALQENLEQITFCNIDSEIDSRAMDPNFVKLYKMAQFTIEYLLMCQEEISNHLATYEQLKNQSSHDREQDHREIEKLKRELKDVKMESKKRRKMLETQQLLITADKFNYHPCPSCSHAFLNDTYLQAHIKRRHPDYKVNHKNENDIDSTKEIQRLKDELNKKETELHTIRTQKAVDEEKIRGLESNNRQLKEDKQGLTNQIAVLDSRLSDLRSNFSQRPSSSYRDDREVSELIRENQRLKVEVDEEKNLHHKADKACKHAERNIEKLKEEIADLQNRLQMFQRTSGDMARHNEEMLALQVRYEQEKKLRKELEDQLHQTIKQTRSQSPVPTETKVPTTIVPTKQPTDPSPVQLRPARPVHTTETLLPQYCPNLVRRLNENPKYLVKFRDLAKKEYNEELETAEAMGILEGDTRLTDLDYRTKMEKVLSVRRVIQSELPTFENVRRDLGQTLDRLIQDRFDLRRSDGSIRSTGSKLVTFRDDNQRQNGTSQHDTISKLVSNQRPSSAKPKQDDSRPQITKAKQIEYATSSDSDVSEDETRPSRPAPPADIRPSPRTTVPTSGVSALVTGAMKPAAKTNETTITRLPAVKPATAKRFASDSEGESQVSAKKNAIAAIVVVPTSVPDKARVIQQKLDQANANGQKPSVNAIAQGFRPSHQSLTNTNNNDDDDDDDSDSLTTLHTAKTNGKRTSVDQQQQQQQQQSITRHLVTKNPLSSGEVSQYTYDSLMKSNGANGGKGPDLRRPATADSAKTSNMDSDDNMEGDVSD